YAPRTGRRWTATGLAAACAVGVLLIVVMHDSAVARPALARVSGPVSPDQRFPLRRFDPTCRLRGWRFLAAQVDQIRDELRREDIKPVLAGASWSLPGELAFYC